MHSQTNSIEGEIHYDMNLYHLKQRKTCYLFIYVFSYAYFLRIILNAMVQILKNFHWTLINFVCDMTNEAENQIKLLKEILKGKKKALDMNR